MAEAKYILTPTDPPPSYDTAAAIGVANESTSDSKFRQPISLQLPIINAVRRRRTILASASPRRRQLLEQIGLANIEVIPSNHPENFPKYSSTPFEYVVRTATAKCLAVYQSQLDNPTLGDPGLVIAADTIVVGYNGEILEKPRSKREHLDMLKMLRTGGRSIGVSKTNQQSPGAIELTSVDASLGGGMRGEAARLSPTVSTGAVGGRDKSLEAGWHKVFTAVAVLAPLESARDPGYAMETCVEETRVRFDPAVTDEVLHAYVETREGADKAGGYGIQGMGALLIERIEGTWDNVVGLPLKATLALVDKVLKTAERDEEEEEEAMFDRDEGEE